MRFLFERKDEVEVVDRNLPPGVEPAGVLVLLRSAYGVPLGKSWTTTPEGVDLPVGWTFAEPAGAGGPGFFMAIPLIDTGEGEELPLAEHLDRQRSEMERLYFEGLIDELRMVRVDEAEDFDVAPGALAGVGWPYV